LALNISALKKLGFLYIVILTLACNRSTSSAPVQVSFDSIPTSKTVTPIINESSGIADSKRNPGFLWVQEDSGNPPQLILLGHDGNVSKRIHIRNATNRDWEDMALAGDRIYIAETGDNDRVHSDYSFYIFDEPASTADTISNYDVIRFKYPDGAHDTEAFIVDAATRDIYIITKRDQPSRVYKLAYPYNPNGINTAERVGELTYTGVVSATISPDGREIILKTYFGLQYYPRNAGESIIDALKKSPQLLNYRIEPQGEAVGFAQSGKGFFTLSEKGNSVSVNLYYYNRK
jgi:hypothetical protein